MASKSEVTKVIKDGIETSYENAGEKWRASAHETLEKIARANQYIVSDMLIAALEESGHGLNNYSALGGVFTRAAKDSLIVKTGNQQLSTRTKSHSAKTVWRSLVYGKADEITQQRSALDQLLINALEFNAATVRYASLIYNKGGVDHKTGKRAVKDFNVIADKYVSRNVDILAQLEKEVKNGRGQK